MREATSLHPRLDADVSRGTIFDTDKSPVIVKHMRMSPIDKLITALTPSSFVLAAFADAADGVEHMSFGMKMAIAASFLSMVLIVVRGIQAYYTIRKEQADIRIKLLQEQEIISRMAAKDDQASVRD